MNRKAQYQAPPVETRKPIRITWIVAAVFLVIVGVIIFSIVKPKAPVVPEVPTAPVAGLASEIVFASFIDDNFVYGVQPNAEYFTGDGVYIYVGITGFVPRGSSVNISEDIEIKDVAGKTVFAKKDFGRLEETFVDKVKFVRFRNRIPSNELKPGRYAVTFSIHDKYAGKEIIKSGEFGIVEKPKEIVEQTIDLSGITSAVIANTRLVRQQTVWGSDGVVISELTFNQSIVGDLSEIDLNNVDASVKIPERFDAGTYAVEIKYINLENKQSVSKTVKVDVVKRLDITDLVFAARVFEDFTYAAQPNAEYAVGDVVEVYLRIVDFTQKRVENGFNVQLVENYEVRNEAGELIVSKNAAAIVSETNPTKLDDYRVRNLIGTTNYAPGKYVYKATVIDYNAPGQTRIERSGSFRLS